MPPLMNFRGFPKTLQSMFLETTRTDRAFRVSTPLGMIILLEERETTGRLESFHKDSELARRRGSVKEKRKEGVS